MTSYAPDEIDVEVGRRLRSLRLRKGVSQADLAKAGGVTFQQIQKYERAANRISASMLCHLARKLEVSPLTLLPWEPVDGLTAPPIWSREVAEAATLMEQMSAAEQRRAVKILRLLAGDRDE
ncbi:helix-turn-helix domain-containing protein [Phenylobacterium sp. LjRoot164]|uniref:helix-turn-helix domain-containing protein n=1 Tax=unclassified Phenylobacterium TaxID=2640670 RepID=UPI003ECD5B24